MRVLPLVLLVLLLSACGTGSDAPAASPSAVATAGASPAASIDLSGVDVCTLLDDAAVQELTGESVRFITQDGAFSCFWGATVPGVPAYVEVSVGRRPEGLSSYDHLPGCTGAPVAASIEARGASCPGDPHLKVWVAGLSDGVLVTVLVNEPSRALAPADMVPVLEAAAADLR